MALVYRKFHCEIGKPLGINRQYQTKPKIQRLQPGGNAKHGKIIVPKIVPMLERQLPSFTSYYQKTSESGTTRSHVIT